MQYYYPCADITPCLFSFKQLRHLIKTYAMHNLMQKSMAPSLWMNDTHNSSYSFHQLEYFTNTKDLSVRSTLNTSRFTGEISSRVTELSAKEYDCAKTVWIVRHCVEMIFCKRNTLKISLVAGICQILKTTRSILFFYSAKRSHMLNHALRTFTRAECLVRYYRFVFLYSQMIIWVNWNFIISDN